MPNSIFEPVTGGFKWPVDQDGYEIVPVEDVDEVPRLAQAGNFYRSDVQDRHLLRRGVIRRKGGTDRWYRPLEEVPGMARRLASLDRQDNRGIPEDKDILEFASRYGLLGNHQTEHVADWIILARYLSAFAAAIDRDDKTLAREIFNDRVVPPMTVRLVGSKTGRPTANWSLAVAPTNLSGAVWLQIANELTTGKRMHKCEAPDCLEWFPFRGNKRFCDDRCRNSAHRYEKRGLQG